jgi:hypothetical protein
VKRAADKSLSDLLDRLFLPVDAAALGVFRIAFGLAVAIDAWRYLGYGWVRAYYVTPKLHFTYLFFDFVRPWPGEWMLVHFWAMSALALLVAAGVFYRVASVLLFLSYAYVFLLEQSVYMNHHYLMLLLALLLATMPAANAYSLKWPPRRQARKPQAPAATVPIWTIYLLRFQLAVVYFYGAIAKLNCDWLRGEPLYWSLQHLPGAAPALARELSPQLIAYAIAYGGLLADALIPLLLLRGRTFWLGFGLAAVFHALNAASLNIGVFSYLMTAAILTFLPPDWPRRVRPLWRRQSGRSLLRRLRATLAGLTEDAPAPAVPAATGPRRRLVVPLLAAYVSVQLLVPLRHLLYPGVVSWTEEGHRFAWHMKLRTKHSAISIRVTDPSGGRSWTVDPRADLTPRQMRKLETFPDILLQYVHFLRDRFRRQGIEPIINVAWTCSLNGRPYQYVVDPDMNLAAMERTWRPATWILPLQNPCG